MQANLPSQQATSPIRATRLHTTPLIANLRTCICLDRTFPKSCTECSPANGTHCPKHMLIKCSNDACTKQFHKACIASLQYIDIHDDVALSGYTCMECIFQQDLEEDDMAVAFNDLPADLDGHNEKLLRLGLFPIEPRGQNSNRTEVTQMKSIISDMKRCMTEEEVNAILDSKPRAYPTAVKMSKEAIDKHVRWGRRFEISMRLYKVQTCDCCGRTQPGHLDSNFCSKDDPPPFEQKHLMMKYTPVWRCTCWGYCKGTQFYSDRKPTHMEQFSINHNGQLPSEFLGLTEPNAIICNKCYRNELTSSQVSAGGMPQSPVFQICMDTAAHDSHFHYFIFLTTTELSLGYKFSQRNGFGPVPTMPPLSDHESRHFVVARELQELLSTFTSAEEAAIRQIVPMISIVRLSQGNIGAKGNTSCVWQDSKLNLILPNLPEECQFIVIQRQRQNGSAAAGNRMKSTKFKKARILRALILLKETGLDVWNIEISEENLNRWPEEGDILDMGLDISVSEVDEDGQVVQEGRQAADTITPNAVPTNQDGDDAGPAPLQNSEIPDESFEAVMNVYDRSTVATGQDRMVLNAVHDAVRQIRENQPQADAADAPQPRFNRDRSRATFQQTDVFSYDGGFVDMNRTQYAWARAFPTIFIPTYIQIKENEWKWVILHDITGWMQHRDKEIKFFEWCEYLMWRSDGRPVSHPTFALVLGNHKMKSQLQQQGRYVINTSDFDPTTTLDAIRNAPTHDHQSIADQVQQIIKRAHIHSSNIPATPAYWKSAFYEFQARTFAASYLEETDISVFHTGSHAEFHDPFLRYLLSDYVKQLSNPSVSGDDAPFHQQILEDDAAFVSAVQMYKNIVTHYLSSKFEIWMNLFMKPVYGLKGGNTSNEFAKTRGALHYHLASASDHPAIATAQEYIRLCAEAIADEMQKVNDFIAEHYTSQLHQQKFPTPPHQIFDHTGFGERKKFLLETLEHPEAAQMWNDFVAFKQSTLDECGKKIGEEFEREFGMSAMHTGNFPEDWVKPGGFKEDDDYPLTSDDMQSSADVIARAELKKFKHTREHDLFQRKSNITNHAGTHCCSAYCARMKQALQKYDPSKHTNFGEYLRRTTNEDWVAVICYECRMGFGELLKYETESGENNKTRGKPPVREGPTIELDKNGQPKFIARRNHPRVVQAPYGFTFYGANNDTQIILVNATSHVTLQNRSPEEYKQYANNLVAAGCAGLEHHNGAYIAERYLSGYQCKGDVNSDVWETSLRSLTEDFCSKDGNSDKTVRSLMAKHMNEITSTMSSPKDQQVYMLAGGLLKRSVGGTLRKCSVTAEFIEDFAVGANEEGAAAAAGPAGIDEELESQEDSTFTWSNIVRRYKRRSPDLQYLNLYKWVAFHWSKTMVVPQFFGYNNTASWPLKEDFCKWTLAIFKPWNQSIDELKAGDGSFSTTLLEYMWDDLKNFPWKIRTEIMRAERNEKSVDLSEASNFVGDADFTPTDDNARRNDVNDDAADAADAANDGIQREDDFEDLDDAAFRNIDVRVPDNHDWSASFDEEVGKSLVNLAKTFYQEQMASLIGDNQNLELFDDELHRPENARTEGQKFIIYHHLFYQWLLTQYENGDIQDLPEMQNVYVEGLPGTGKTFVINTIRNMIRKIYKSNRRDAASAPTGCAAALINGSTHARSMSLPVGKKAKLPPSNIDVTNLDRIKYLRDSHKHLIARIMDESSMLGQLYWAWLKHRHEELRRPVGRITDEEFNDIDDEEQDHVDPGIVPIDLTTDITSRPWGGVPFIYSFGDTNQLPPVAMKAVYDNKPSRGRDGGAERMGRIAFHEFINPSSGSGANSTIVFLDDVLRQTDPIFKKLLQNMREGAMDDADCELIFSRMLADMSPDDRKTFERDALHLVPTWKQANAINIKYLQEELDTPIARYLAQLSTSRGDGKNCCISESNFPLRLLLCTGAKVMLLYNFIVEYKLMNGSVGIVRDMCFKFPQGDQNSDDGTKYVVVEFPDSTIPENKKLIPGKPATWVPIPLVQNRCEKKCCSINAIPLQICKSLSIHKSQGMTVGQGKQFKKVVVHLPIGQRNNCPGLELVAISRAMAVEDFAIGNDKVEVTKQALMKIGKSNAYKVRKDFLNNLRLKAVSTQKREKELIGGMDPQGANSLDIEENYKQGCEFLLKWYRDNYDI
jgi:hypothetical protein